MDAGDDGMRLFAAEAGERFAVVDSNRSAATATRSTVATRSTITTIAALAATSTTATATEVTTVATLASTATATATTATSTAARVARLFLERVVEFDALLGVAATFTLATSLLFALEVILIFGANESLGRLPLLVVLSTLVGGASLLQTEVLDLVGSLLGEPIGV